ncbi:MAG: DNA topoisomerase IV subunit A [Caulobacterales bacterium]
MSKADAPDAGRTIEEPIDEALSKRYLAYALSTITSRALPDVRDGLKPVHRRILYVMRQLKLSPDEAYKKSARIVGDVMGRLHPHGDQAIYDAIVRLAQDFSVRYMLVDGQGNFGSIDGDSAAAMRYTESRLTRAGELLLQGVDDDTVDFRANYDGSEEEPVVLPAAFPNLLANGANGIAVGMATSIPPHNVSELIDAALHLIANPRASSQDLLQFVPGPDFPTGGIVVEPKESIAEAYATGRGGFRLRARWAVEDAGRGMWRIVITEIPYQVEKAKLVADLAALIEEKRSPLLGDVRDESAEDLRIILEPRNRSIDPAAMMESLFKLSTLETRISLNLNVLDAHGAPRVMSLREALQAYLDHRREVLQRRSQKRLREIAHRLEVLGGYLIAYLNIDEVIRIIREEDEPKPVMIKRFGLTDVQAEAILNMRLRSLRRLEEFEIKKENNALTEERQTLETLVASERRQWTAISGELKTVQKDFGPGTAIGKRRSTFQDAPTDVDLSVEHFVEKEPITVVLSQKGWIRAMKGHVSDLSTLRFKEGDEAAYAAQVYTTDKLLLCASDGRVFTLAGDKLPGGRGMGDPVRLLVELGEKDEPIGLFAHRPDEKLIFASSDGHGFIVKAEDCLSQKRGGKQVLNLAKGARAQRVVEAEGDYVAVLGENRKLLIFKLSELPEMSRGKGVRMQSYKDGGLVDVKTFEKAAGFGWIDAAGRQRECPEWKGWIGKRAQSGKLVPNGFPKANRFSPNGE